MHESSKQGKCAILPQIQKKNFANLKRKKMKKNTSTFLKTMKRLNN